MRPHAARWVPLLEGEDAAAASRAIDAIARDLRARSDDHRGGPSVTDGRAGAAIFFRYLDRDGDAADELGASAAQLVEIEGWPSLCGGFAGVGWAFEHLRERVDGIDAHTSDVIDDALVAALGGGAWRRDFDLISGLVGFGVYARERMPHGGGAAILARVVDRLAEVAEGARTITWHTPRELLPPESRDDCPHGWYNLGLAHGVPGVIAILGVACEAGIAKARPLLEGAVRWLLERRQPNGACKSTFALFERRGFDDPPRTSRLAWCYGDPGAAIALDVAARCAGERAWEDAALAIARRAAARSIEDAGVRDAGLCHGAAGVAHIFNRLAQTTGDAALRDAARAWFRAVIAMRRDGEGIGGYRSWGPAPGGDGTRVWYDDPALLTGAPGIALALRAAISDEEPRWDRLLLMS
ncbi:MAG TPA: lanthionine synthetase C family protein [Kofleriaceae bacterium]|jgi:hypothetical protein|nr:lanthionine synthetase C family protein [Kofleriaceae bacterium]